MFKTSQNGELNILSLKYFLLDNEEPCLTRTAKVLRRCLATGVVVTSILQTISFPLYTEIMNDTETGSDPFIASFLAYMWLPVIFWSIILIFKACGSYSTYNMNIFDVPWFDLIMAGLLAGISQVLLALASLPHRTPVYMQAIFQQSLMIPFTALARYVILCKGKIIK